MKIGSHAALGRQSGKDLSHSSGIPWIASSFSRQHTPRNLSYPFESYVTEGRSSSEGRPSPDSITA
jgi:hypothetical protein